MRIVVDKRVAKVYPWGQDGKSLIVPIIDSMAHIGDDGVLTQMLECDSCQEWSDDVAWDDYFGGGLCAECWREV